VVIYNTEVSTNSWGWLQYRTKNIIIDI